jgi:hypothetical protein
MPAMRGEINSERNIQPMLRLCSRAANPRATEKAIQKIKIRRSIIASARGAYASGY